MKSKFSPRKIAYTACLLGVCLAFQMLKSVSVYLTGPMVNAVIIIASVACGLASGVIISVLSPLGAYFIGATPVINMIPAMMLVIMAGNSLIALFSYLYRNKKLAVGLTLGTVSKAVFLWISVWYVILPLFGQGLPEKMISTVRTTFSVTQLITAALGSIIAWIILNRLKKMPSFEDESK